MHPNKTDQPNVQIELAKGIPATAEAVDLLQNKLRGQLSRT